LVTAAGAATDAAVAWSPRVQASMSVAAAASGVAWGADGFHSVVGGDVTGGGVVAVVAVVVGRSGPVVEGAVDGPLSLHPARATPGANHSPMTARARQTRRGRAVTAPILADGRAR
jgi:hypothetical protein